MVFMDHKDENPRDSPPFTHIYIYIYHPVSVQWIFIIYKLKNMEKKYIF